MKINLAGPTKSKTFSLPYSLTDPTLGWKYLPKDPNQAWLMPVRLAKKVGPRAYHLPWLPTGDFCISPFLLKLYFGFSQAQQRAIELAEKVF